jgi:XTP/dITP diphosphohydrolase
MELWLATSNKGKINELKSLLENLNFVIHSQSEMSFFSQPPEDGKTFEENAKIKARALHAVKPDSWTVADDSGLVVEGLGGLPGIHSARYAGANAQPSENNAKLLKMMQIRSATNRNASFYCCLVAISPKGEEFICDGELKGQIGRVLAGSQGFGYDPLFIPEGETKTLAELEFSKKNAISHRSIALRKLLEILKN